jgi:hypothetical protein
MKFVFPDFPAASLVVGFWVANDLLSTYLKKIKCPLKNKLVAQAHGPTFFFLIVALYI